MTTRCTMRRRLRTRQIVFSARSIVSIIASALTMSASRPAAPRRLARIENWEIAPITGRTIVSGISVCSRYFCSAISSVPNIGNAENTASITVNSGTSEMMVVKVRPPAVRARRSSRKRRTRVFRPTSQGQVCSASTRRSAAGVSVTRMACSRDALLA